MEDIIVGIKLFNDADFFSAHDYFESKWVECQQKDRLFFQGLVQISVGCYHLVCGNYKGALSQLNKGKTKLINYLPSYKNIDLKNLLSGVDTLINDLNCYFSGELVSIDLTKIPKIHIQN